MFSIGISLSLVLFSSYTLFLELSSYSILSVYIVFVIPFVSGYLLDCIEIVYERYLKELDEMFGKVDRVYSVLKSLVWWKESQRISLVEGGEERG